MKKVKVTLIAMVALGMVGGVVAFNASRTVEYCITSTVNGGCPIGIMCPNGKNMMIHSSGIPKCYVLTTNIERCPIDMPLCNHMPTRLTAN